MAMKSTDTSSTETLKPKLFDPVKHHHLITALHNRIVEVAGLSPGGDPEAEARTYIARALIKDPEFRLWVVEDDGKLVGFEVAEVQIQRGVRVLHSPAGWVDPAYAFKHIVDNFIIVSQNYCQVMDLKKITIWAHSSHTARAVSRRYGFKLTHHIMELPV